MPKEDLTKFRYINCICCGRKIHIMDPGYGDTEDSEILKKLGPESQMWKDGIVLKGDAGYGSDHDGEMYYIGVCDVCININLHNGRIVYYSNYLGDHEDGEIDRFQKLRNRYNNLDDLSK